MAGTKILHRKIIHATDHSFSCISDMRLTFPLHCHSEYELIYIKKGHGKEFIGDSVRDFSPGDLILIGANVPHLHLCDSVTDKTLKAESLCSMLQFPRSVFPERMKEIGEYAQIDHLLEKSALGIKFNDGTVIEKVLRIIQIINRQQGINRILSLFTILNLLGKCKDFSLVASPQYVKPSNPYTAHEPVSGVYAYITSNAEKTVSLQEIADHINMSPASLCRHFKQKTGKTIFRCLHEIRIEHACKLLTHSNLSISQIAYEAGFNNLSHFNRQFKLITKQTPTAYRKNIGMEIGTSE